MRSKLVQTEHIEAESSATHGTMFCVWPAFKHSKSDFH